MKSKAERLDELVLDYAYPETYCGKKKCEKCKKTKVHFDEFKEKIIAIFKECVPDHKRSMNGKFCECFAFHKSECGCGADWSDFSEWNNCRNETLKNMEEML